jgi:hypothetical protein
MSTNLFYEDLSKLVGRVLFEFNIEKLRTISDGQLQRHVWQANGRNGDADHPVLKLQYS